MPRRRKSRNNDSAILFIVVAVVSGGVVSLYARQIELLAIFILIIAIAVTAALVTWRLNHDAKIRAGLRLLDFDHIDTMTGIEFEKYVGAMLPQRGFSHITYTSVSNDDGIDITARKDGQRYAIQTKRFSRPVGKAHVFPITSARNSLGFDEAMLVTNNSFTKDARAFTEKSRWYQGGYKSSEKVCCQPQNSRASRAHYPYKTPLVTHRRKRHRSSCHLCRAGSGQVAARGAIGEHWPEFNAQSYAVAKPELNSKTDL